MKIKYEEYIQSDEWKVRRQQVLDNPYYGRPHQCLICHGVKTLAVHHMSYKNLGEELDHELCILCSDCHTKVHYKNGHHSNVDIDINVFCIKFSKKLKSKKKKKSKAVKDYEASISIWKQKKNKPPEKTREKTTLKQLGAMEYYRRIRSGELKEESKNEVSKTGKYRYIFPMLSFASVVSIYDCAKKTVNGSRKRTGITG